MNANKVFREIGKNMRAGANEGACQPPKSDLRKTLHGTPTNPLARAGRKGGAGDKRQRKFYRAKYGKELLGLGGGLMERLLSRIHGKNRARYGAMGNDFIHRRDLK